MVSPFPVSEDLRPCYHDWVVHMMKKKIKISSCIYVCFLYMDRLVHGSTSTCIYIPGRISKDDGIAARSIIKSQSRLTLHAVLRTVVGDGCRYLRIYIHVVIPSGMYR